MLLIPQLAYVHSDAEDHIQKEDKALELREFSHLTTIAESVGWRRPCYLALNHDHRSRSCVESVKNLVRIVSYPDHATLKCPKCEIAELYPYH